MNSTTVKLKNSITVKLLTTVFTIYLAIAVTMTLVHVIAEFYDTKETIIQDMNGLHGTFELGLSAAIWNADTEQIQALAEGLSQISFVVGVSIQVDMLENISIGIVSENPTQQQVNSENTDSTNQSKNGFSFLRTNLF